MSGREEEAEAETRKKEEEANQEEETPMYLPKKVSDYMSI